MAAEEQKPLVIEISLACRVSPKTVRYFSVVILSLVISMPEWAGTRSAGKDHAEKKGCGKSIQMNFFS